MSNRSIVTKARAQIYNRRQMRRMALAVLIHGSDSFFAGFTFMHYCLRYAVDRYASTQWRELSAMYGTRYLASKVTLWIPTPTKRRRR